MIIIRSTSVRPWLGWLFAFVALVNSVVATMTATDRWLIAANAASVGMLVMAIIAGWARRSTNRLIESYVALAASYRSSAVAAQELIGLQREVIDAYRSKFVWTDTTATKEIV